MCVRVRVCTSIYTSIYVGRYAELCYCQTAHSWTRFSWLHSVSYVPSILCLILHSANIYMQPATDYLVSQSVTFNNYSRNLGKKCLMIT